MRPLICKSMAMLEAARRIERAARADSPVLIWGEDGTGKKLVAETIHRRSRRRDGPLVMLATEKCNGRSAEDELFGTAEQLGSLAAAAGGTLLIDEITGLPPTGQAKLLDAAEGRCVAELKEFCRAADRLPAQWPPPDMKSQRASSGAPCERTFTIG